VSVIVRISELENMVAHTHTRTHKHKHPQTPPSPNHLRYFQAGGAAVAVYDYDLRMVRAAAPSDAPRGAIACVPTPKGYVQCL
jgi:hypothetical protein